MTSPFVAEIRIFSFNFAPQGWAFCDGRLMPILQNAALFSLLGTTYGGDGQSTFALPDLRGCSPIQYSKGHWVALDEVSDENGAQKEVVTYRQIDMSDAQMKPRAFDDSPSGSNMQPYLMLNFCIALHGIFPHPSSVESRGRVSQSDESSNQELRFESTQSDTESSRLENGTDELETISAKRMADLFYGKRSARVSQRRFDEIEKIAVGLRQFLQIEDTHCPDILSMTARLDQAFPGFEVRVRGLNWQGAQADCTSKVITIGKAFYDLLSQGETRARITFAHELGHIVLTHCGRMHRLASVDRKYRRREAMEESEASYFARAFLAPGRLVAQCQSAREISERFKITLEAALTRLVEVRTCQNEADESQVMAPSRLTDFSVESSAPCTPPLR